MIIGDSNAGKTAILKKYLNQTSKIGNEKSTIGIDYAFQQIEIDGTPSYVHYWDLAGDDLYIEVRNEFYTEANGIILVFDSSNRNSYSRLQTWIDEGTKFNANFSSLLILGNKSDLNSAVTQDEVNSFAKKYGAKAIFVSAKTGDGIAEAFSNFLVSIKQKLG